VLLQVDPESEPVLTDFDITFTIYVDWDLEAAAEPWLVPINSSWDQTDEEFCSSVHDTEETVAVLSFDRTAANVDAAGALARSAVNDLTERLSLPGKLRLITVFTETGYRQLLP
jgi:hypothetical protein